LVIDDHVWALSVALANFVTARVIDDFEEIALAGGARLLVGASLAPDDCLGTATADLALYEVALSALLAS
jgi:hypothetical protein